MHLITTKKTRKKEELKLSKKERDLIFALRRAEDYARDSLTRLMTNVAIEGAKKPERPGLRLVS